MSDILANMSVVLSADISEFKSAMATAKSELKGLMQFGEAMKGVGESMTMYLSLPIALAGVEAVRAFDKQTLAVAQVENGLRSTGNAAKLTSEQLQAMAAQIQKKSIYGDEEVLQKVTTQLLTFSNISGETFARTQQAAVDLSSKLGQDLQTSAIQLGKALNDPTQSLGALRRAGISFSADQIAVIHQLQATGELGKAQTIILNELERQYGGTAEAASKAGMGGIRQLGNQLNDLMESFGKIILEAIKPFIGWLSQLITKFDGLDEGTKKTIVGVLAITAAIGPLLFVMGSLITILPFLRAGIILLEASLTPILAPILAITAAVGLAAYLIYQNWDKLVAYFTKGEGGQLFSGMATAASDAVKAIKTAFGELASIFSGPTTGSITAFGDLLKYIFRVIADSIIGTLKVITGVVMLVVDLFNRDWAGAFKDGKEAVEGLMLPINALLGRTSVLSGSFDAAFRPFKPVFDGLSGAVGDWGTATDEAFKKATPAAKKLTDELAKLAAELRSNTLLANNLPGFFKGEGGYDAAAERIKILTDGLKKLVEDGLNPASAAFQKYLKELYALSQAPDAKMADTPMASRAVPTVQIDQTLGDRIRGLMGTEIGRQPIDIPLTLAPKKVDFGFDIFKQALQTSDAFKLIDNSALAFGDSSNVVAAKNAALTTAMQNLLKMGVGPLDPAIKALKAQLKEISPILDELAGTVSGSLADSFTLLGDTMGKAMSGGHDIMKSFLAGFTNVMAGFLSTFGKQLIAAGIGKISLESLMKIPGAGPAAIIAGIALVALAGMASATLSAGPEGMGSGGGGGNYTPHASTAYTPTTAPTSTMAAAATVVTHKVQVVMSGRELRGTLEYETDRLGRATGGR